MSDEKQVSTVVIDDVISLPDGRSLRMTFDLAKTLQKAALYVDDLLDVRRIPYDINNLPARDPILMYLTQQYSDRLKSKRMVPEDILAKAVKYYQRAMAEVQKDAYMIAMFAAPENLEILSEPALPYDPPTEESDPLVLQMPVITKDLDEPIERRLKRLMDILITTGAWFRVEGILETLSVRMNIFAQELVEVDDQGFQPAAANAAVLTEVQPISEQPQASKKRAASGRVSGSNGDVE